MSPRGLKAKEMATRRKEVVGVWLMHSFDGQLSKYRTQLFHATERPVMIDFNINRVDVLDSS